MVAYIDGEFWELSELDGLEIANSGVFNISITRMDGIFRLCS